MSSGEFGKVCQEVPSLSEKVLKIILMDTYGLNDVSIRQLHGWVDKNYLISSPGNKAQLWGKNPVEAETSKDKYILKVLNSKESEEADYIDPKDVYLTRLFRYIRGMTLDNYSVNLSNQILYQVGWFVAAVDRDMQPCATEPGFVSRKPSLWHLENVPQLNGFLTDIQKDVDQKLRLIITEILEDFQKKVLPFYEHFQKGLIHGDCNPTNLLILERRDRLDVLDNDYKNVFGIIDFGETGLSCFIFELAILVSHFMALENQPGLLVQKILEGYNAVIPLNEIELTALKTCVAARVAQVFILTYWYDGRRDNHGEPKLALCGDPWYKVLLNFDDRYDQ